MRLPNQYDSDSEEDIDECNSRDDETLNQTPTPVQKESLPKKQHSWVYDYADKFEQDDNSVWFRCRFKNTAGKLCNYKVQTKKGQTSGIATHLKVKHQLKQPKKLLQTTLLDFAKMPQREEQKPKSFREAFAQLIAKQYLPFSIIEEKVLQDSYMAFHNEYKKNGVPPAFVTDKTIACDIAKMAETYIQEMTNRFATSKSKLSLCMDVWTGPNKMSFLGITFTYIDEDFVIRRGLLDMVKLKEKHSGYYMAEKFQEVLDTYKIDKDMIAGITQDNASNCGTCADALVENGFDRDIFYGCFLHVMNLGCQAAIEVYDPKRKKKTNRTRLVTDSDFESFSGSEDSQDEEDSDYDDEYEDELKNIDSISSAIGNVSSFTNYGQGNLQFLSIVMIVAETFLLSVRALANLRPIYL